MIRETYRRGDAFLLVLGAAALVGPAGCTATTSSEPPAATSLERADFGKGVETWDEATLAGLCGRYEGMLGEAVLDWIAADLFRPRNPELEPYTDDLVLDRSSLDSTLVSEVLSSFEGGTSIGSNRYKNKGEWETDVFVDFEDRTRYSVTVDDHGVERDVRFTGEYADASLCDGEWLICKERLDGEAARTELESFVADAEALFEDRGSERHDDELTTLARERFGSHIDSAAKGIYLGREVPWFYELQGQVSGGTQRLVYAPGDAEHELAAEIRRMKLYRCESAGQ